MAVATMYSWRTPVWDGLLATAKTVTARPPAKAVEV